MVSWLIALALAFTSQRLLPPPHFLANPEWREAERLLQEVLSIRRSHGEEGAKHWLGPALRARTLFKKAGDARGADTAANLAVDAYLIRGMLLQARRLTPEIVASARASRDPFRLGRALILASTLSARTGEFERAFHAANEARRLFIERKDPAGQVAVCHMLAIVYSNLGQHRNAQTYLNEGLELLRQHPMKRQEMLLNRELARVQARMGELAKAHSSLKRALDLVPDSESAGASAMLLSISEVSLQMGLLDDADAAATQALDIARRVGSRRFIGSAYTRKASVAFERGDLSRARILYERAIAQNPGLELESYIGLGKILERHGDYKGALTLYEKCASTSDRSLRIRSSQEDRYTLFQLRIEPYRLAVGALVKDYFATGESDEAKAWKALQANERIHSRILTEHLAHSWNNARQSPVALRQQLLSIEIRRNDASRRLLDDAITQQERRQLSDRMRRLELRAEEIRRQMAMHERYGAQSKTLQEYPLSHIQKLLPPDTAVLEYSFGEPAALFVLTRDRLSLVKLPRAENLQERIPLFVDLLGTIGRRHTESFEAKASHRLYLDVLDPGVRILPPETRRLMISPVGPLELLPFESLHSRPDGRFLIEDFTVSYIPSISLLPVLRDRAKIPGEPRLAAFADPDYALRAGATSIRDYFLSDQYSVGPIPYSKVEAESVAMAVGRERSDLYLGGDATESRLKAIDLSKYQILHFATHSIADPSLSDRSALVLSLGTDMEQDGFLQVREIYDLRLNAELVVLSGCQTARASGIPGEGLQGLARAFFLAGARSLLASRWKVQDRPTSLLMTRFYQYLREGRSTAESLRLSKLDMIRQGSFETRHWAGFVLLGDPDGTLFPPPRSTIPASMLPAKAVVAILTVALLGLCVLWYAKTKLRTGSSGAKMSL